VPPVATPCVTLRTVFNNPFEEETIVVAEALTAFAVGGVAVAVFTYVLAVAAVAEIENVTEPPEGKVAAVPVTVVPETVTLPHAAPPLALPQDGVPTIVTPVGIVSVKTVLFWDDGPLLEITILYSIAPPGLVCPVAVLVIEIWLIAVSVSLVPADGEALVPFAIVAGRVTTICVPAVADTVYTTPTEIEPPAAVAPAAVIAVCKALTLAYVVPLKV